MKKITFIIALFASLLLVSCGGSENTDQNTDTSTEGSQDQLNNKATETIGNALFEIQYPSNWTRNMEVQNPVHFLIGTGKENDDDNFSEHVYLVVKELFDPNTNKAEDFNLSLERSASDLVKQIPMINNGKFISNEEKENKGMKYREVVYSGTDQGNDLKYVQRIYFDKGRSYILSYTGKQNGGFEKFYDDAEMMMNSFTIK